MIEQRAYVSRNIQWHCYKNCEMQCQGIQCETGSDTYFNDQGHSQVTRQDTDNDLDNPMHDVKFIRLEFLRYSSAWAFIYYTVFIYFAGLTDFHG